eukprot:COSAG01_NODE_64913_length_275_cov_0.505682_1_plen_54_part_10
MQHTVGTAMLMSMSASVHRVRTGHLARSRQALLLIPAHTHVCVLQVLQMDHALV